MINKNEVIDITQYYSKTFELTVQIKDSQGKPTGRTKTLTSDDAGKIAHFWYRHRAPLRKKKGGKTSSQSPNDKEAAEILKKMYGDK